MAASLNREQVLELLLNGYPEDEENNEPEYDEPASDEQLLQQKLVSLLDSFEGGQGFNHNFFRDSAVEMLMPLVRYSTRESHDTAETEAFRLLSSNFSSLPILRRESKHWLEAINRRLGGRNRIRNPYYAEIKRDIPHEIFGLIVRVVKNVAVNEFSQPHCFHGKSKKGEVLSFTTCHSVSKLFALLSGLNTKAVNGYFKRSPGGRKKGHRVKMLVSDTKDFAFVYKFSKQQLTIGFHYGEWNTYGFPQHS